ncbi:hypothetical protein TNCT_734981 [Trichonephila clavata]|uniref:Uncharacterized protein n=1 Tax=Trichonephila clavata TaxID=2740835 RepID=A0A8X6L4R3_TRICU|nr:hypothetical protein TNCT_734981 [Trichonephila clavata]
MLRCQRTTGISIEGGHRSISDEDELSGATCSTRKNLASVYYQITGGFSSGKNLVIGITLPLGMKVTDLEEAE